MNLEVFKIHTASRKFTPIALQPKEIPLQLPKHYSEGGKLNMLDPCRVLAADLDASMQKIVIDLKEPEKFNQYIAEKGDKRQRVDLRLSRFKRSYGGMNNPPIRIWERTKGGFKRWKGNITPGCIVECGFAVRQSKGRYYYDLHRDIIMVEVARETKRRKVEYFSDGES
jgi:hypothetical protein